MYSSTELTDIGEVLEYRRLSVNLPRSVPLHGPLVYPIAEEGGPGGFFGYTGFGE